jgi:hypothetical protein
LLLRFARHAGPRFQLDEDWLSAPNDLHIREAAPYAALLLKDAAQPGKWLVLQLRPERIGRVEVLVQHLGEPSLLRPFLPLARASALYGQ